MDLTNNNKVGTFKAHKSSTTMMTKRSFAFGKRTTCIVFFCFFGKKFPNGWKVAGPKSFFVVGLEFGGHFFWEFGVKGATFFNKQNNVSFFSFRWTQYMVYTKELVFWKVQSFDGCYCVCVLLVFMRVPI